MLNNFFAIVAQYPKSFFAGLLLFLIVVMVYRAWIRKSPQKTVDENKEHVTARTTLGNATMLRTNPPIRSTYSVIMETIDWEEDDNVIIVAEQDSGKTILFGLGDTDALIIAEREPFSETQRSLHSFRRYALTISSGGTVVLDQEVRSRDELDLTTRIFECYSAQGEFMCIVLGAGITVVAREL